ncbi:MAG: SUF system Fe-S cluster assembly regulator [Armatimonadetes bacterium]|nr:SUF system Fe-S cluster assembly regulator [Armatimonadota bacterium]
MIRLTRMTDYGLLVMSQFAERSDIPVRTGRDLADETGLPLPTVSKVLKLLAQGDLLSSHRGVQGGYRLSRPPEEISVADMVSALEGPIAMTLCNLHPGGLCEWEASCRIRENWQLINRVIRGALDNISLAEMVRPMQEGWVTAGNLGIRELHRRRGKTSAEKSKCGADAVTEAVTHPAAPPIEPNAAVIV